MDYTEPLYRPPSEARSLIFQITNGCSYNKCTFCTMYRAPQKKFRVKAEDQVREEIRTSAAYPAERVFLADGDALTLSVRRLEGVLDAITEYLPRVRRVSAYCLPRNLRHKSVEDLRLLREKGLSLVYVGVESGDDEVLARVRKGETFESSLGALEKLKAAGIRTSVMVLTGLGGREFSEQHAQHSAALVSRAQPDFLATLVLMLPQGEALMQEGFDGQFEPLTQTELLEESRCFIEHLELERTLFRSDHASNYLVLKGTLGRDKERLLSELDAALSPRGRIPLRPEWARGL